MTSTGTLTMESMIRDISALGISLNKPRFTYYTNGPGPGFLSGTPLITSPLLTETIARDLTRWETLRTQVEDLADFADLVWPWARIVRSVTKPLRKVILLPDGRAICHPALVPELTAPRGLVPGGGVSICRI